MPNPPRILYCHCAQSEVTPRALRRAVLERLCASGAPFEAVPDLCALAQRKDPALRQWIAEGGRVIAACHERAVRGLFAAAGAPCPADAVVLDLRGRPEAELLAALPPAAGGTRDPVLLAAELETPSGAAPAWFPVIDAARCTACRQCLSFCLFGVYAETAAGGLEVRRPANCKPNCPACARVCPERAIMFPKYGQSPINGGAVEGPAPEPVKADLSALLGGDVYQSLRGRRGPAAGRFDAARDRVQAAEERRQCLAKLQQQLDIPPELLTSWPLSDALARPAGTGPGRPDETTK